MHEREARCHLLAEVLSADGMMSKPERDLLEARMTELGLDDAERDRVRHFEGRDGAEAVLAALPEAARRAFVDQLAEAALVENSLSPIETAVVARVARALGLG